MNPLPPACHAALATHGVTPCVLVDGAMQHAAGVRLARTPGAGISLFDDLPEDAQALGPWLLSPAQAQAVGLDGSGPGVNWLASALAQPDAADHLRHWLRDGHPRGLHYTRLADGRVLRAAMTVWTPAQRAAFCMPWRGWWLADRDGDALALALPEPLSLEPDTTAGWTDAQREALAQTRPRHAGAAGSGGRGVCGSAGPGELDCIRADGGRLLHATGWAPGARVGVAR
jgi:hypothetical protein